VLPISIKATLAMGAMPGHQEPTEKHRLSYIRRLRVLVEGCSDGSNSKQASAAKNSIDVASRDTHQ
jgi:hypothetical protein